MARHVVCPSMFALAFAMFAVQSIAAENKSASTELFEKYVRPVLVERCQKCHGNLKDPKGGLRLDSREALLHGGDSGPAVVAGDPDHSPLIEAVRHESLEMPPDGKLTDEQISNLVNWVKLGAPWPSSGEQFGGDRSPAEKPQVDIVRTRRYFWSFKPVSKPTPPKVQHVHWMSNDVDQFVLAAVEKKGLAPSLRADKRTLIRRATFDLIGLPPTPQEVQDFLLDNSPDAYATVIDRLLASPHYGERWGRRWLDVARYADNKGYVFFFETAEYPWAWTYRDYVVRAFNEDMPYDRFIIEQLAADQLELGTDKRSLAALGFLTVGSRFRSNEHDIIDDRIDVVSRGLMGLTVTCARCHDHKFDPIPTRDYYSLYGVFASTMEPAIAPEFEPSPNTEAYAAFKKEMEVREGKLNAFVDKCYAEATKDARTRTAEYLLTAHNLRKRLNAAEFRQTPEPGDLNPGMIFRWKFYLDDSEKNGNPVFAPWHAFANLRDTEFQLRATEVLTTLSRKAQSGAPINALVLERLAGVKLDSMASVADAYAKLLQEVAKTWEETLAKAKTAGQPEPTVLGDVQQEQLRQVFYGPDSPPVLPPTPGGELELIAYRAKHLERKKLLDAIEEWCVKGTGAPPRAMTLEDRPRPSDPRVFIRGNSTRPGEAVPRQFLEVLSPRPREPFQHGSGRLELARAVVDPGNPLTARVMVNRIWMHHFGAGIVRSPGDFGLRSEPPTHPELLDYLANRFVNEGWSIKKMHRLLMLSSAYQQASKDRPECRAVDPENRLLWRMNRQRLDFETMRDAMLAVSGRLDRRLGGKPFRDATDPADTRRTLYAYVDRMSLPGVYRAFDFPTPDTTSVQRFTTTVPQQALFMLNNRFVDACAAQLASRPQFAALAPADRISQMYMCAYGRKPAHDELTLADAYVRSLPGDKGWARLAQSLLLTNEFMFAD